MQLSISGHHVDLTESLTTYINQKFEKLERHSDQLTQVHVVLSVEKLEHHAEATAHLSGGDLFANAHAEDMYAAIDSLVDKMDRQLIKHKEKATHRHHGSGDRSAHH
ncbi:MAG: putative sigma-54 modulation protein [Limisphaerales bacterium]|jgi:putative sigma-54 modulation protein